jgi:hypothetical protein
MVVQVAPQSQFFRQVERQLPPPSDQGMLSIATQGCSCNLAHLLPPGSAGSRPHHYNCQSKGLTPVRGELCTSKTAPPRDGPDLKIGLQYLHGDGKHRSVTAVEHLFPYLEGGSADPQLNVGLPTLGKSALHASLTHGSRTNPHKLSFVPPLIFILWWMESNLLSRLYTNMYLL